MSAPNGIPPPTDPMPHLDDEAVSAVFDGEGTPEEARHAERCPTCARRVEALRPIAALVGGPVGAMAPERRDAAIETALATMTVRRLGHRRAAPPAWVLGAAAALLAVVGLVGSLGRGDDDDQVAVQDDPSAFESESPESGAGAADAGATALQAAAPPISAGDLGELAPGVLRARVGDALAGQGGQVGRAMDEEAAADDAAPPIGGQCEAVLREGDPALGALRLVGAARLDGAPVGVLAFDAGGERPGSLRVYVVDDDCAVRVVESFSP